MTLTSRAALAGSGLLTAAVATFLLLGATPGVAETVKTVNGAEIDSNVLDVYVQNRLNKPAADATAEEREALIQELTDIYLLSTQDNAESLQEDPEVAAQIELQKRGVLAQAFARDFFAESSVSEEEIQAEYAEQVEQAPPLQFKARHILVPTQGVASNIIERLDEGADFQELAAEKSTDSSAQEGGDIGWFSPDQMVEPFSQAVAQLDDGDYTEEPVQSQFGWHVILREDSRETEAPPMESVRDQLTQSVQQKKFQAHLESLRAEADTE